MRVLVILAATVGMTAIAAGSASPSAPLAPCHARVLTDPLPVWALNGSSDNTPHVIGQAHRIVGVLFGYPLVSPARQPMRNKILWVARKIPSESPLRLSAQRMKGRVPVGKPVAQSIPGGPGPSIVNLPAAGCWRVTLRWSGLSDKVDLVYRRSS